MVKHITHVAIISAIVLICGWSYSNIISTEIVSEVKGNSFYSGSIENVKCKYREFKNKSYYDFALEEGVKLHFLIPRHRCDTAIVENSNGKEFSAYFIGGLPLQVEIGNTVLMDFQAAKSSNNFVFWVLTFTFPIIYLIVLGGAMDRKRKSNANRRYRFTLSPSPISVF